MYVFCKFIADLTDCRQQESFESSTTTLTQEFRTTHLRKR